MIKVLNWVQNQNSKMAYIPENFHAQFDKRPQVKSYFSMVQCLLGQPLLLDEVQCGSYAHRL